MLQTGDIVKYKCKIEEEKRYINTENKYEPKKREYGNTMRGGHNQK